MTDAELDDLVRRFNACAVPRTEWTHQAHLAVGLWHVSQYKRKDALQRLRAGITRLNESNGVVNSATGGYHETVTRAYVALLSDFAARHADKTAAERVRASWGSRARGWTAAIERRRSVRAPGTAG